MNEELINWQIKYESGEVIITGDEEVFVVRSDKNLEKGRYPVYIEDAAIAALKQIFNLDVDAVFDKDTTGEFVDYFTDEINNVLADKTFFVKEEYYPPNSSLNPKILISLQVSKLNEMYQKLSGSPPQTTPADPDTGGVEFDGRIVEGAGGYVYGQSPDGTIEILDGPTSVGKVLKEGPAWEAITEEIGPFPEPIAVNENPDFEVVVFEYEDLNLISQNVISALEVVGKSYECAYRNGEYNNPGLRFGKKIKDFKKLMAKLDDRLRKGALDAELISQVGFKIRTAPITNITYVEEIQAIYPGIMSQDTILIRNAQKKDPFNNQASVYLLKNASKISQQYEIGSSDVFDYKKFIAFYLPTSPNIGIDAGAIAKYGASQLDQTCGTNLAGNFANEFAGNQTRGELTQYKDCVSDKFPKTFYTIEDRENLLKVSENDKLNRRRVDDALNTIEDRKEDTLTLLKEDIDNSKTLKDLQNVFDSLDLKIIQDLLISGLQKEMNLTGNLADPYQVLAMRGIKDLKKTNISTLYFHIRNGDFADLKERFDEEWSKLYGQPPPSIEDTDVSTSLILQGQNLETILDNMKPSIGIPTSAEDVTDKIRETLVSVIKEEDTNFPSEDFMVSVLDFVPSAPLDSMAFRYVFAKSSKGRLTDKYEDGLEKYNDFRDKNRERKEKRKQKEDQREKNKKFTLPKMDSLSSGFSDFKDITGQLIKIAEKVLERAAVEVLKKLAIKMLSTNLEDSRALVDSNLNGSPKNTITNIMRNGICTNRATVEEVSQKVLSTLENFAALNSAGISAPTEQDVREFMEKTSSSLSEQEIIDLFRGNPSEKTLRTVSDVLNNSMSGESMKVAIPTDSDIENVFLTLGSFINVNGLQLLKDRNEFLSRDFNLEVCDRTLGDITTNDRLKDQLSDRVKEEEIEEQANLAVKNALDNLDDFLKNVVAQGEESPAQAAVNEAVKIYESEDQDQAAQNSELFDETFESLTTQFVQDLMMAYGAYRPFSKGYFDMILSVIEGKFTPKGTGFMKLDEGQRYGQRDKVVSNLYNKIGGKEYRDGNYFTNKSIKLAYRTKEYTNNVENVYGKELNIVRDTGSSNEEIVNIPVTYNIREETLNYINSTLVKNYTLETLDEPLDIFRNIIATNLRGACFRGDITSEESNDCRNFIRSSNGTISASYGLAQTLAPLFENTIMPEIVSGDQKTKFWNYGSASVETVILDACPDIYGEGYWYRNDKTNYTGWRNIYNEAIPTSEFDVEKDPLFNFNSCAQFSQEYYDSVPEDVRVKYPRKLFEKVKETPFSRVNSKIGNSMLAGLINSIIKLYVFDAVIKITPLIGLYELNTENYTNAFSAYISNNILEEVLKESLSTPFYKLKKLGQKGYYYIFLEQVVQSYVNMVSAGLADPSLDAKSSLSRLTASLESWNPETATVKDFRQFIEDSKNDAIPIIQEMVEGVFPTVAREINRVYSPKTKNINDKIVNEWLYTSEIVDVPETIDDTGSIDGFSESTMPFFIQKYIKLSNETDYRIIKISEYKDYEQKDLYPNVSFGIRLVFYPGHTYDSAVYSDSVKLDSVFSRMFERDRAFLVKDGTSRKHNIPFYSFERETTPGEIERGYPSFEMLSSLKASPGFEILFKVCYPVSDLLSAAAVYVADNFILSIEEARGSGLLPFSDLGRWNGKIFEVSQKYIKNMMETSYYARSSDYRKQILKNINKEQIVKTGSAIAISAISDPVDGAPKIDNLPKDIVGKSRRGKEVFPQRDRDGADPRCKKERNNR